MLRSPRMLLLAATLAGALSLGAPVGAAAPRFIIASGILLPRPILLDDWQENLTLMGATVEDDVLVDISTADLAIRPSIDLALFWDATIWEPLVQRQGLGSLQPQDANQHARFYPATGSAAPLFVGMADGVFGPHRMGERGLAVLARHGVPTRLAPAPTPVGTMFPTAGSGPISPGWGGIRPLVAVMIGMALIVGGLSRFRRRSRRAGPVTTGPLRPNGSATRPYGPCPVRRSVCVREDEGDNGDP